MSNEEAIIENSTLFKRLAEPFPSNQVNWRILKTLDMKEEHKRQFPGATKWGLWLAYLDARVIQERFDNVLTPARWQVNFKSDSGIIICEISVKIGDEWIVKADGSHIAEANRGKTLGDASKQGMTEAFKRAAVLWGVGRYLYYLGSTIAPTNDKGRQLVEFILPSWALPGGSGIPDGEKPQKGWVKYNFIEK